MRDPDERERDDESTKPATDPAPESFERRSSAPSLPGAPQDGDTALDEVDLRDMLRGAMRPPAGAIAPSLLRGVQGRLRARSHGKFYGDGWSTAESPRSTYLITSIIMLAVIALVFLVLIPWSGTP